jgi:hypothetical protein
LLRTLTSDDTLVARVPLILLSDEFHSNPDPLRSRPFLSGPGRRHHHLGRLSMPRPSDLSAAYKRMTK